MITNEGSLIGKQILLVSTLGMYKVQYREYA